jgi:AraC family transcriptional regulator, positive regulator of tynA and feaB
MEAKMHQSNDYFGTKQMDLETSSAMAGPLCGPHEMVVDADPSAFSGWLRSLSVYGLTAVDVSCNAHRFERTCRDVRLDDIDHYKAVFQVAGQSTIYQDDQCVQLAVGDVALFDMARPITRVSHESARMLYLQLPRRSLVSHLGFEPQGGACRRSGTPAARLLYEVILHALKGGGAEGPRADSYMQLAIYDLLGALFAPSDPPRPSSTPGNKLFMRIRSLIKERFADPDFGPVEAASETGISLRYLQKLFTQRGSTCTEFIYSLRLNHAARLLDRRRLLSMAEPISAIAYDCGFRDYTHFARKFRHRFGYPPGAHAAAQGGAGPRPFIDPCAAAHPLECR